MERPTSPLTLENITLSFCWRKSCHGYQVDSPPGLVYHHVSLEHLASHLHSCPDKIIKPENIHGKSLMDDYDMDYRVYPTIFDRRKIHLGSAFVTCSYPLGNGLYFEFKVDDLVHNSPGVKFMNYRVWQEILNWNIRQHQNRLFYQHYWPSKRNNTEMVVDELDLKLAQRAYYTTSYTKSLLRDKDKFDLDLPLIDARPHRNIVQETKKKDSEFMYASWCKHWKK